jgi:NAD(P)-dependent dehydrogenase (short-subunit alcohol dehydrogenase family)
MAVTNTYNSGLGAVIARRFAAEGSNVAINYASSEDPAQKLAEELRSEFKVKAEVYKAVGLPPITIE